MTDSEQKWHSGPPPFVGWWNASHWRDAEVWRWWDGRRWPDGATPWYTAQEVAECAKRPAAKGRGYPPIQWTHYWPAGARVPRVEP